MEKSSQTSAQENTREIVFADSHLHLQAYESSVLEQVIKECNENNVKHLVCNSTSEKDFDQVTEIKQKYSSVIAGYGIHPWYVEDLSELWEKKLLENLETHQDSIVGEIGLDFHKKIPKAKQKEVFEKQFKIACDLKRPVNIHCVRAHGAMADIMEKYIGRKKLESEPSEEAKRMNIILHSYAGKEEMTKRILGLNANFYFSFSLMAAKKDENFKNIPLDNLLIETDSPYQMNEDLVQKYSSHWKINKGIIQSVNLEKPIEDVSLNEPKYLHSLLCYLSALYNMEAPKLSEILFRNFRRALSLH